MQEEVSEKDIALLEEYLEQYNDCIKYKHDLEKRLIRIDEEMNSPLGGKGYSALPSNSGGTGAGSASFTLKKADIEDRIEKQREQLAVTLTNVMDILEYLPVGSRSRKILEYRYIDNLTWDRIYKKMHLSHTPCFRYRKDGYKKLLSYKRVNAILREYEERTENQ